jgi:hypothetical protein
MKKIISTIALVLVCTVSANAQDKKPAQKEPVAISTTEQSQKENTQQIAKVQAYELVKYLGLKEDLVETFYSLIIMKQEVFADKANSDERKTVFMESFNAKLKGLIDAKSFEKLVANKDFYTKLMATPEMIKK